MNKKIMVAVEKAFIDRFGPWAGWAHNTLFISELASQRERLPEHLQPAGKVKTTKGQNAAALKAAEAAAAQEQAALEQRGLSSAADSDALPTLARKRRKTAKARQAEADQQEGLGIARRDASTDASESALSTQAGDSVPQDEQLGLQAKQSLTSSSSVAAAALAAVDQAVENAAVLPVQRSKKKKGKGMN
ncbi:hypothetical protein MMC14_010696 [Varicellaria rhodocarpa]|nr:hypothetical protein [Varicellaria rhodocarpa]